MGKGDKRSFRGKITIGTHGNTRPKKHGKVQAAAPAPEQKAKPEKKAKSTSAKKENTAEKKENTVTRKKTTTKKSKAKPKEE